MNTQFVTFYIPPEPEDDIPKISDPLLIVLMCVRDGESVRQINPVIGLSQQMTQRRLQALVDLGLTKRELHENSTKTKRYVVTEKGKKVLNVNKVATTPQ